MRSHFDDSFPRFSVIFGELPQEESAGVGLGITVLVLMTVAFAWRHWGFGKINRQVLNVGALAWVALLAFMLKTGSEHTARLLAPYYPLLLLPALSLPGVEDLVRRRWHENCARVVGVFVAVTLILTPARPLWPGEKVLGWLCQAFPHNGQLTRAREVYAVYRQRNRLFDPLLRFVPDSVNTIGFIGGWEDAEGPAWQPLGRRKVVRLETNDLLETASLEWIIAKNSRVAQSPADFGNWIHQHGGEVVAERAITSTFQTGPEQWSVLRFKKGSAPAGNSFE